MNNAEKTRAVYQAAENFYRTACADDYNFSRKAGKNARSMLAAYVDNLKKWDAPAQYTDGMILNSITLAVKSMLQVAYFKPQH